MVVARSDAVFARVAGLAPAAIAAADPRTAVAAAFRAAADMAGPAVAERPVAACERAARVADADRRPDLAAAAHTDVGRQGRLPDAITPEMVDARRSCRSDRRRRPRRVARQLELPDARISVPREARRAVPASSAAAASVSSDVVLRCEGEASAARRDQASQRPASAPERQPSRAVQRPPRPESIALVAVVRAAARLAVPAVQPWEQVPRPATCGAAELRFALAAVQPAQQPPVRPQLRRPVPATSAREAVRARPRPVPAAWPPSPGAAAAVPERPALPARRLSWRVLDSCLCPSPPESRRRCLQSAA